MILTINDPRVFRAIVEGSKRFEGRREKPALLALKPGAYLIFFLEGTLDFVITRVREIRRFETIEKMVKELWRELIPFAHSMDEALEIYRKYYNLSDPAVAIGIDILHSERVRDPRVLRKILGIRVREALLDQEKFLPEALE